LHEEIINEAEKQIKESGDGGGDSINSLNYSMENMEKIE
jgi:hypothetical protein